MNWVMKIFSKTSGHLVEQTKTNITTVQSLPGALTSLVERKRKVTSLPPVSDVGKQGDLATNPGFAYCHHGN